MQRRDAWWRLVGTPPAEISASRRGTQNPAVLTDNAAIGKVGKIEFTSISGFRYELRGGQTWSDQHAQDVWQTAPWLTGHGKATVAGGHLAKTPSAELLAPRSVGLARVEVDGSFGFCVSCHPPPFPNFLSLFRSRCLSLQEGHHLDETLHGCCGPRSRGPQLLGLFDSACVSFLPYASAFSTLALRLGVGIPIREFRGKGEIRGLME